MEWIQDLNGGRILSPSDDGLRGRSLWQSRPKVMRVAERRRLGLAGNQSNHVIWNSYPASEHVKHLAMQRGRRQRKLFICVRTNKSRIASLGRMESHGSQHSIVTAKSAANSKFEITDDSSSESESSCMPQSFAECANTSSNSFQGESSSSFVQKCSFGEFPPSAYRLQRIG